jgi:phosphoribosylformylglycinamidine cyclo-ligase
MEPTRIYVKPMLALMQAMPGVVKGMAHITGGGLTENIPRILREELTARIDAASWTLPPLFQWLQQQGNVDMQEMYRVFNCGIGMAVVVAAEQADAVQAQLQAAGETVYRIGCIDARAEGEAQTLVG